MAIVIKFGRRESDIATAGCQAVDQVGDVVYIHNRINGQFRVRKAQPRDETKFPAAGVIISKISDILCRVQWKGETPAIYSGLDIGAIYFLDLDGQITRTPPEALSGGYSFVQSIGIATAEDKLRVMIDNTLTKRIQE